MKRTQFKGLNLSRVGILVIALTVAIGMTLSGGAAAKKKKRSKAGGTVDITQSVGTLIPDGTATTNGLLDSTITVAGKKFQGTQIRDVNVTLTTLAAIGPSPADDLQARVTAPNGATTWLISVIGLAGGSVGPLTLDDESPNVLFPGLPPAPAPTFLASPYIGSAQPDCAFSRGGCVFSAMDGGPVTGTWTLRIYDVGDAAERSFLSSWRLTAVAGKPFQTK